MEAEIDQRTVDLRIRLENIGTQPFYPVLSEREKVTLGKNQPVYRALFIKLEEPTPNIISP